MNFKIAAIVYITIHLVCIECEGRDLVEQTSMLDGVFIRSLFHSVRDFTFRLVGATGRKTRGTFLQDMHHDFPCDLSIVRSRSIPDSVHKLRPGNFMDFW